MFKWIIICYYSFRIRRLNPFHSEFRVIILFWLKCHINLWNLIFFLFAGQPEPTVQWFNGSEPLHTTGSLTMVRHVVVNRLEISHLTREAYNSTLRCQASNTKLAPPVERIVRLDMLCKYDSIWCTFQICNIIILIMCLSLLHLSERKSIY